MCDGNKFPARPQAVCAHRRRPIAVSRQDGIPPTTQQVRQPQIVDFRLTHGK